MKLTENKFIFNFLKVGTEIHNYKNFAKPLNKPKTANADD